MKNQTSGDVCSTAVASNADHGMNTVIWDWNIQSGEVRPEGIFTSFGYNDPHDGNTVAFWTQRLHPEDRPRITSTLQAVLDGNRETWSGKYRFRCKDGSYAKVFDRGYVIRDDTGRAVRMVGAMIDITEQLRLERAHHDSDERFRLMVEGVKDYAIYMLDSTGQVVNWNSGAEKTTGYTAAEILGQHFSCFFPNADVQQNRPQMLLQIAAAEGQFHEEAWRVRKDRTQYWADVLITAVFDEAKCLCGYAKIVRDITERKYAQEVLRTSEERTRLIVESAHDAFVSMDPRGLTTDWNRRAEKILGWSSAEAVGQPLANFVVLPAWLGIDGPWSGDGALPPNTRFETQARHRDGHCFPVEVSMTLIQLGQPARPSGFSAFLHDISERKQAEAALRQLPGAILRAQELERNRVARELHDSVGQFLTLVKMRIQSIEQMPDQAAREVAAKARQLLTDCIEEVRRIAHNLVPSELEDLGLIAAVRNLCAECSGHAGVKIKLKDDGIPEKLGANLKLSLFRIIQEALTNIVKHSEATHVEVHLTGTCSSIDASIKDNGRGFDPGHARNGSRMGLVNIGQRAAIVGGSVKIESEPGLGAAVRVHVPLASNLPSVPAQSETEPKGSL